MNTIYRKVKIAILALLPLGAGWMGTSCSSDFLDRVPEGSYNVDNFYTSDAALDAATAPLYNRAWFDYNQRAILSIGSLRANDAYNPYLHPEFTTFQVTALNTLLADAWKSFYSVVSMANAVIDDIENRAKGEVTQAAKERNIAEARLMRGVAYFDLVRLWGPVILYADNETMTSHPVQPLTTEADVFRFIIEDLTYAASHLPEKGAQAGRATKWAAEGMLAKVYLARSGWGKNTRDAADLAEAMRYAADVCEKSGLNLLPKYEDLFKYKQNNNEESLLAMQWVPLGDWYVCNTLYADLCFSTIITGGINVWGGPQATVDQLSQYEAADSLRLNASFFTKGAYYPYICMADGGYTHNSDRAYCKKGCIGGPNDDNDNKILSMNSPLNTYILRLADVYLTYAEAALGNNDALTAGNAFYYFNKVRERAGLEAKAAVTLDDIIRERRCEFGMEYMNWYEMTTWYKWKPAKMLQYFNAQQRGVIAKKVSHAADGSIIMDELDPPTVAAEVTENNIFFPYPESDVIQNPLLKESPQAYY